MDLIKEKSIKEEAKTHVLSFYSFIFTSIILILVGIAIKILVPDSLDIPFIKAHFNLSLDYFVAEKSEKIQYYVLVLLLPFVYVFIYKFLSKFKPAKSFDKKFFYISILELISAVFLSISLNSMDEEKFFFTAYSPWLIYILGLSLLAYCTYKYQVGSIKAETKFNMVFVSLLIAIVAVIFWVYCTPSYGQHFHNLHHFDAYYYPIYKVYSGLTIGHDFNCLYGLYPYLYELILKLTGGISILKISFISATLIVVSIISVASMLWFYIRNKVLWFVSVGSFAYVLYILPFIYSHGYYLQFNPHRTIFLCLLMGVCAFYLNLKENNQKMVCLYFGYIFSFLSIIWNFETAFIVNAVWFLFLSYLEFCKFRLNNKQLYISLVKLFCFSFLTIISAFIVIYFIPFFRIGEFLSLSNYFSAQALFYGSGFYMIKMKLFEQPWLLLILVYVIGFIKSLNILKFMNTRMDKYFGIRRSAIYFVLSLIGFGIFIYYQGRSHIAVLGAVSFPAVILLGLFMQEYCDKFFNMRRIGGFYKNISKVYFIKFFLIFALFSMFICTTFQLFCLGDLLSSIAKHRKELTQDSPIILGLSYIRPYVEKDKNIDLMTLFASIYYTSLGKKDLLTFPAVIDLMTKDDYKKVLDWLNKTNNRVVFDNYTMTNLLKYEPNGIEKVINKRFKVIAHNDYFIVIEPK